MIPVRRAIGLAFAGLVSGCILAVGEDPSALSTACHFAGEAETDCGRCVAAHCAADVERCCKDRTCRPGSMPFLDGCAKDGAASACAALASTTATGRAGELGDCVRASCSGVCGGGAATDGGVATPDAKPRIPGVACAFGTDFCRCKAEGTASGEACSAVVIPSAVCCADKEWPRDGRECQCQRFACTLGPGVSCTCAVGRPGGTTDTCGGAGVVCCAGNGTCSCGTKAACAHDEILVTACSRDVVGCLLGDEKRVVSSCTE